MVVHTAKYLSKKVNAITAYTLNRTYWKAETVSGSWFHRVTTKIEHDSLKFPIAILQYFFDGGREEELRLAPHGNRKGNDQPYFRTAASTLKEKKRNHRR